MKGWLQAGVGLVALGVATTIASSAAAQAAPDAAVQAAAPAPAADDAGVQEIVVTAQRRSENLQDVPISIAVATAAQLQQAHVANLLDVSVRTPGLVVTQAAGYAQAYIRGIGTTTSNPGLETSVATYVDEIYVPQQIGSLFDLVDVNNVQVLKGPQGSLYGRNATGGAILISTADPTDQTEGSLKGEYGNFDHREVQGMVNIAAGDQLSFRVAGRYYHDDGYVRNLNTGKDMMGGHGWLIRGKMLGRPTDRLTVLVTAELSRRSQDLNVHKLITPAPLCVACAIYGQTTITPPKTYRTDEDDMPPTITKVSIVTGKIDYDLDAVKLTSITGYRFQNWNGVYDIDGAVGEFQHFIAQNVTKSFQQEERLTTDLDGPFNFLGGFVYSRYNGQWRKANIFGDALGGPIGINAFNKVISNSYSVYGEGSYNVTDALKITAGGRYTKERKVLTGTSNIGIIPHTKVSFSAFTPRVVIAYDTDIGNFYLSYNQGFKSGGINTPTFGAADTVRPEKIKSLEGGAKLDFLDKRLKVNLSAFHYWYDDLQVTFTDISNGGQRTQNAASARTWGIEFGVEAAVARGLQIGGEVDYLHARYRDYPFAAILTPNVGGLGLSPSLDPAVTDLSGFQLSHAPNWTATGHIDYETLLGNDMKAGFSISGRYSSSFYFFAGGGSTLRLDQQKGYFVANASAFLDVTPQIRLGAYVTNLTDKYYVTDRETYATGAFEIPARPRTYGGSVAYKF